MKIERLAERAQRRAGRGPPREPRGRSPERAHRRGIAPTANARIARLAERADAARLELAPRSSPRSATARSPRRSGARAVSARSSRRSSGSDSIHRADAHVAVDAIARAAAARRPRRARARGRTTCCVAPATADSPLAAEELLARRASAAGRPRPARSSVRRARSPSDQTTPPITAASRSSSFSACGSRSTRAVTMPEHGVREQRPASPQARACGRTPRRRAGCPPRARRPLRRQLGVGGVAPEERLDEPRGVGLRQRPERHRERVALPPPQSGRRSSSSGRAQRDDERAARPRRGRRARRRSRAARRRPTAGRRSRPRAGARSASASRNLRQPAKARHGDASSSAAPGGPTSGREADVDPAALRLGDEIGDDARELLRGERRRRRSRGSRPAP